MKVGDLVRVLRVPKAISAVKDECAQTVFRLCVGRPFPVVGIEHGMAELEVGEVVGQAPVMHSIWIEPDCIEVVGGE